MTLAKKIILSIVIILIVLVCITTSILISKQNHVQKVITCKGSMCEIFNINGLKKISEKSEFSMDEVMLCNVEGVYKKDYDGKDVIDSYELYLTLKQDKGDFKIRSKDGENLVQVCRDIYEKKNFYIKFYE